jgi:DNA repair exonuclease SbcCD ATPase subunit
VIDSLQDQQQKVDALNERADQIEEDLDQRIKDLKDLLANIREKKALDEQFKEASALANDNLGAIKDLLSKLPG